MFIAINDPAQQRVRKSRRLNLLTASSAVMNRLSRGQEIGVPAGLAGTIRKIQLFEINEEALVKTLKGFKYTAAHNEECSRHYIHPLAFPMISFP